MWPPAVEVVAATFRSAGVEARLEELPPGEDTLPGPAVRTEAFECDGRLVVTLVPADRELDARKIGCTQLRAVSVPRFPFSGADVLIETTLLAEPVLWIEAGSPRHVAGLAAGHLARLLQAKPSALVADPQSGGG